MPDQRCRICGSGLSQSFVDLGLQPLSNAYVNKERARDGERCYPLHAFVCGECFLVQLEEFESPDAIFSDYAYFSSFSTSWLQHAETYVDAMIERFKLGSSTKVIEVASNDGYLLQFFRKRGIPVLGIEPAANVAAEARKKGVETKVAFFGSQTAEELIRSGDQADLMAANNVLAHVPNIRDFMTGFRLLLKPQGVATFEFPHLLRQIKGRQFDQVYHEHFSYLSLIAVAALAKLTGLRIFDVEEVPTHGGSLRVFTCHPDASHSTTSNVQRIISEERDYGLDALEAYKAFAADALDVKLDTLDFLIRAKRDGKLVCGYGAAAKGNTLLNYLGAGPELVRVVADRSPHKQGKLLPGSRIPVVSPEQLDALRPDYVLILPWNLKEEIVSQMEHVRNWGGKFAVAIPRMEIL